MHARRERGVPVAERALLRAVKALPDWESARLFLEVARHGSFRAAANALNVSVNRLRAGVSELEQHLGVKLLTRHVDGVRTTEEGYRVATLAQQMEHASFELMQSCRPSDTTLTGEVRLAVTEGLGGLWVSSKIAYFQREHPRLMLDFQCAMDSADVLRLEADISVQLTRPTAQDVKITKLGRLHLVFFAARSYLDTYGEPHSMADLAKHRIIVQADKDPGWRRVYDKLFPGIPPEELIALRSNISSVSYWSIASGVGVGMLPTYVYALGAPLVPVDLPVHHELDIWMACHPDAARIPRVRQLMDWLVDAFSPKRYPWFRDEFIPPARLRGLYRGETLFNAFDGFAAGDPTQVPLYVNRRR